MPDLLIQSLIEPATMARLSLPQWDLVLRQARQARVLGRLGALAEAHGLLERIADQPRQHLISGRVEAEHHARVIRWETQRLREALGPADIRFVLLKGAAYIVADLPPGAGRLTADVDILVPASRLDDAEKALLARGWRFGELDAYDQRYYRQWTHELPPMYHATRGATLDVHHTILPITGRVHPDPQLLLQDAVCVADGVLVLALSDMILHSAAHLFHEGEMDMALRDLADLDALMRHGSRQSPDFWQHLVERSRQLQLQRSLYYALRLTGRLFQTPIPEPIIAQSQRDAPGPVTRWMMDRLLMRVSVPGHPDRPRAITGLAKLVLFVRGHWLRMPLHLLVPHLVRKAMLNLFPRGQDAARDEAQV